MSAVVFFIDPKTLRAERSDEGNAQVIQLNKKKPECCLEFSKDYAVNCDVDLRIEKLAINLHPKGGGCSFLAAGFVSSRSKFLNRP